AALRHTGILVVQVIVSLAVNVVLAGALVPRWGAEGAAAATLATEVAALALILAAAWGRVGGLLWRPSGRGLACGSAAALCAAAAQPPGPVPRHPGDRGQPCLPVPAAHRVDLELARREIECRRRRYRRAGPVPRPRRHRRDAPRPLRGVRVRAAASRRARRLG